MENRIKNLTDITYLSELILRSEATKDHWQRLLRHNEMLWLAMTIHDKY